MAKEEVGAVERAAALYKFVRTDGRNEMLERADAFLDALARRAKQHKEHENDDLLNETQNIATFVLLAVERLCRKWEESDHRGLTY